MRCRIVNPNLKAWSKALHMLCTTGDEDIHFSFTGGTMTLTAYDASLTSCVTCTFFKNFFDLLDVPKDDLIFTIQSKRILKPFRSIKFLNKGCNFCEIKFEGDGINVIAGCRSGAEILYTIPKDATGEHLEDASDPRNYKTIIRTDPKLIIRSLANFTHRKGLPNVTLQIEEGHLILKSSPTRRVTKEERMYTEIRIKAVDFDDFDVKEDCELTVPIREFKMITAFAEHLKIPVYMHFQTSTDPAIFQIHTDFLQATMTLAPRCASAAPSQNSDESPRPSNRISNVSSQGSDAAKEKPAGKPTSVISSNAGVSACLLNSAIRRIIPEPPVVASPVVIPTDNSPSLPENDSPMIIIDPQFPLDNENEGRPPPRKKLLRDLFPNIGKPFDIYAAFPGHDTVIVGASDDEDE